nr:MAG TPA: hypothetical protein [Caudoviricetes sp.]
MSWAALGGYFKKTSQRSRFEPNKKYKQKAC